MCIRDSLPEGDAVTEWDKRGEHHEVFRNTIRYIRGEDPEPVSYTHLRAHETVLDLVCRLLLEKKKNTQPEARQRDEQ